MATKQVIVIRKDLKMRRGKEIAQGAHAAMAFLTRRFHYDRDLEPVNVDEKRPDGWAYSGVISTEEMEWMEASFKKVTLQVDSERELMELAASARKAGVECHVITDSGATEFGGVPTKTCLALGPDTDERIDPITGHLRLY